MSWTRAHHFFFYFYFNQTTWNGGGPRIGACSDSTYRPYHAISCATTICGCSHDMKPRYWTRIDPLVDWKVQYTSMYQHMVCRHTSWWRLKSRREGEEEMRIRRRREREREESMEYKFRSMAGLVYVLYMPGYRWHAPQSHSDRRERIEERGKKE